MCRFAPRPPPSWKAGLAWCCTTAWNIWNTCGWRLLRLLGSIPARLITMAVYPTGTRQVAASAAVLQVPFKFSEFLENYWSGCDARALLCLLLQATTILRTRSGTSVPQAYCHVGPMSNLHWSLIFAWLCMRRWATSCEKRCKKLRCSMVSITDRR